MNRQGYEYPFYGQYPAPGPYSGGFQAPYGSPQEYVSGYPGIGPAGGSSAGGGLNQLLGGMGNIRQMIERLGGIDGVLDHLGKMQKIMNSVQQLRPMLKLVMGSTKANALRDRDFDEYVPRRRRKRRRTGSSRTRRRRRR